MSNRINVGRRWVGDGCKPLVIAEIGINHEGSYEKAVRMVDDAFRAGCECIKIQSHIPDEEMIYNTIVPANADESIWDMMQRCSLSESEEQLLKAHVERKGMIFLCTPFSRLAANRMKRMGIAAIKIGSGECNNYPLIKHIASFGIPVILSTGMNDINSIAPAVSILREHRIPFALMHCTSIYPTPYHLVRLGAIRGLREAFPDAVLGLSDHSIANYTCFAAVALGASIVEKHFTSDRTWPGPDIPISITPDELKDLIQGSDAISEALGGSKVVLDEEHPTIRFAYASVVTTEEVKKGAIFTQENIWVKRPGTGELLASDYYKALGNRASRDIPAIVSGLNKLTYPLNFQRFPSLRT